MLISISDYQYYESKRRITSASFQKQDSRLNMPVKELTEMFSYGGRYPAKTLTVAGQHKLHLVSAAYLIALKKKKYVFERLKPKFCQFLYFIQIFRQDA